jgi:hypothetical protein
MIPIRMPHLSWPQRIAIGLAGVVIALVGGLAGPASATDANTAVSSTCPDGHWTVKHSVTSIWNGTIHVELIDPHSSTGPMELGPYKTITITERPDTGSQSWTWTWKSSDGHLHGDAVSGSISRPVNCDSVPSTSTPPTTTCEQANPPRDCGASTTPAPPATTVAAPTTTTPSVVTTAPEPTMPVVTTAAAPPKQRTVTPSTPGKLPPTGAGEVVAICVIGGLVLCLVGWLAARVDRERRRQRCS